MPPSTTRTTTIQRDYDYLLKLLIVGDTTVGKSSLLSRFVDGAFPENHLSTIGVDFKVLTTDIDNQHVKLQLWDTAGQERFRAITTSYYRGAHGLLIVFDKTNRHSFESIPRWYQEASQWCRNFENVPTVLVANKCDLAGADDVTLEEMQDMADRLGVAGVVQTSAKTGANVGAVFQQLARAVLTVKMNEPLQPSPVVRIDPGSHKLTEPTCCGLF